MSESITKEEFEAVLNSGDFEWFPLLAGFVPNLLRTNGRSDTGDYVAWNDTLNTYRADGQPLEWIKENCRKPKAKKAGELTRITEWELGEPLRGRFGTIQITSTSSKLRNVYGFERENPIFVFAVHGPKQHKEIIEQELGYEVVEEL